MFKEKQEGMQLGMTFFGEDIGIQNLLIEGK
jgi:hypothetical protein